MKSRVNINFYEEEKKTVNNTKYSSSQIYTLEKAVCMKSYTWSKDFRRFWLVCASFSYDFCFDYFSVESFFVSQTRSVHLEVIELRYSFQTVVVNFSWRNYKLELSACGFDVLFTWTFEHDCDFLLFGYVTKLFGSIHARICFFSTAFLSMIKDDLVLKHSDFDWQIEKSFFFKWTILGVSNISGKNLLNVQKLTKHRKNQKLKKPARKCPCEG